MLSTRSGSLRPPPMDPRAQIAPAGSLQAAQLTDDVLTFRLDAVGRVQVRSEAISPG
jgi:hypothetical protein